MEIKKTSGNYKILASGNDFLYEKTDDFHMDIIVSDDFSFDITLKFETGDADDHNLKASATGNSITFICTNFNKSLGTGTVKPIEVATYRGKKVFIHFWVRLLSNITRKIEYTFFIEG